MSFKKFLSQRFSLAIAVGLFFASLAILWWVLGSPGITTIGENVSVGGKLTVSGNVGIGTSSPGQKIHIYGSSGSQRVRVESAGTTSSDQASLQLVAGNKSWISWVSGDSDQLRFFSSSLNSNVMTLTSAGNVGIGTTSPGYKLDIAGALRLQPSSAPTGANGVIYYDSTENKFKCYQNGAWVDCIGAGGGGGYWAASGANIYNTNTGNVGIGTTAPNAKLEVLSTGTQTRLSYSGSVYANLYVDSAGNLQISTYPTGKDIQINDNNLRVCAGGSCPTPSYSGTGNLQVEGQVQINAPAGTAPLIVQSNTLVTNLNADLLDGYHASQFRRPITIYLTASTFQGNHNCDDNPATCCATGYTMCRAWQLLNFDPRIDNIETTGIGRNTNPINQRGWVESGVVNCRDWERIGEEEGGAIGTLRTDGEGNLTGFGHYIEGQLDVGPCSGRHYVWCCRNL
jgi:hypothetical protein